MSTDRAAQIAALSLPLDQLPDPLPIPTIERPFDVTIRPPGSKSITNRALLLAALADGTSELRGPLIDADDAQVMLRAIQQLGAKVEIIRADRTLSASEGPTTLDIVRITGVNGQWKVPAGQTVTLNLNNAGTATRFLTAAAILTPADSGGIIIDGDARMRERPIGELAEALNGIGAAVEWLGESGFPPLRVLPYEPGRDDRMAMSGWDFEITSSSQFISGLLMVTPFLTQTLEVTVPEAPTSKSYIEMTLGVMARVGIHLRCSNSNGCSSISTPPQRLASFTLDIEPDASGATYFEAAAALLPAAITTISGLDLDPRNSLQGDTNFVSILTAAAAKIERRNNSLPVHGPAAISPFDVNLSDMPDTAMTAAVLACFASPTADNPTATSTLRGLRTLRVKETDRLAALQTELTKFGAEVEIFQEVLGGQQDEGLRITPPPFPTPHSPLPPIFFDTYHDHRMAMSLALIGLRRPNVFIRDPKCVAKTYPTFWKDLATLYQ